MHMSVSDTIDEKKTPAVSKAEKHTTQLENKSEETEDSTRPNRQNRSLRIPVCDFSPLALDPLLYNEVEFQNFGSERKYICLNG